jgi:hypothetical protein
MKKIILLFVFALSFAFAGTSSAQAPAKKAPEKTVQASAKQAEATKAVKPAEVKKDTKMAMK